MRTILVGAAALAALCLTACNGSTKAPPQTEPAVPTATAAAATQAPVQPVTPTPVPVEVVKPKPVNRCAHNRADQLVLVKIKAQRMWLCHDAKTVRTNAITTGMSGPYTKTPTGHYRIQGLNRNSVLTLSSGATYDVKYWIPFNAPLYGFHDSSWQHFPYGSAKYKTDGSHGCVHMPLKDIAFLYHWADIGAHVSIS